MIGKVVGTASLLRRAGRTARHSTKSAYSGQPACWDLTLAINGLSDQRREELIAGMEQQLGTARKPPVGDGRLRVHATTTSVPLHTAAVLAVSNFAQVLRDVGLQPDEIAGSSAHLKITRSEQQQDAPKPANRIQRLGQRLGTASYGLDVAAAEMFDVDARQRLGDRTMVVGVLLTSLSDEAQAQMVSKTRDVFGSDAEQNPGEFFARVDAERVGGPLGALLLTARGIRPVLEFAPNTAQLQLEAVANDG